MLTSAEVGAQEFTVMFYNTENLFDTTDDTTKNDDEFLPDGSRRWTGNRYHKKVNALARVIAAAGEWELPALVGLCEVENEEVVRDLVYGTILSAGNYGIVHRDSPDPRGIDLALLYRRDYFSVSEVRSWLPVNSDSIPVTTRNLLYVKLTEESDTLHLILCHLPSRRGGVLAAGDLREKMIRLARSKVDSIMIATEERAAVIVMGDFNATPEEKLLSALTEGDCLTNLSDSLSRVGKGSYRYQGSWEMIDQILVSASMTDPTVPDTITGVYHINRSSFTVIDAPFLLTEDETYPGLKPFPTYGGYRWSGGYSDHLPVLIKIQHN